jgi:hypothetical protein
MRKAEGQVILGYDWHFCTIYGEKQIDKAIAEIRKGAWVMVEAHLAYKEMHTGTPEYKRMANVIVEYWQPIKGGDPDYVPRNDQAVVADPEAIAERGIAWDQIAEHKEALNETRDSRGGR